MSSDETFGDQSEFEKRLVLVQLESLRGAAGLSTAGRARFLMAHDFGRMR